MIYSFDGAIANEVGVSAAVVFHHIAHWIKFNEVHDQNFVRRFITRGEKYFRM